MYQSELQVVTPGMDGEGTTREPSMSRTPLSSLPTFQRDFDCRAPRKPPVYLSSREEKGERKGQRANSKGHMLAESVSFSLDDSSFPGILTQKIFSCISFVRAVS